MINIQKKRASVFFNENLFLSQKKPYSGSHKKEETDPRCPKDDFLQTFDKMINDEINFHHLVHSNVKYLKSATNSEQIYVYLTKTKNNIQVLYLSSPTEEEIHKDENWDISSDSPKLAAVVAQKKELLLLNDIQNQELFLNGCYLNTSLDNPKSVLFLPLVAPMDDECLAVFEFQRRKNEDPYGLTEITTAVLLLGWIGSAVNLGKVRKDLEAQSDFAEDNLRFLKNCIENQMEEEQLVTSLTQIFKTRISPEKCVLFVNESKTNELYAFEEALTNDRCTSQPTMLKKLLPVMDNRGLLGHALKTKDIINIQDIYDPRFDYEVDRKRSNINVRNALVVSLWKKDKPLAVIMLLNKTGALSFKERDELMLKRMLDYIVIALDNNDFRNQISHHQKRLNRLMNIAGKQLLPCQHDITFKCDESSNFRKTISKLHLPIVLFQKPQNTSMCLLIFYMFEELVTDEISINKDALETFIIFVKNAYKPNSFHNFLHAFDSFRFVYTVLKDGRSVFTFEEKLALILASLVLDIDHPGLTNNLFYLSKDPKAKLYQDSYLEYHHILIAKVFLKDNKIFEGLDEESYEKVLELMRFCIITTDLSFYFTIILPCRILSGYEFSEDSPVHRKVLMSVIMVMAGFSEFLKKFETNRRQTRNLFNEFYNQGDIEKSMGFTPLHVMDRDKKNFIPQFQICFMNVVLLPSANMLSKIFPETRVFYENGVAIKAKWLEISEKDVTSYSDTTLFGLSSQNLRSRSFYSTVLSQSEFVLK